MWPIALMTPSLPRTRPEDGDIVAREQQRDGMLVYVLYTAPGPDQYVLHSRQEAVVHATTVAKRESVRAWLTNESYQFVLLKDYRVSSREVADVGGVLTQRTRER
jgi:hypothetical protein